MQGLGKLIIANNHNENFKGEAIGTLFQGKYENPNWNISMKDILRETGPDSLKHVSNLYCSFYLANE